MSIIENNILYNILLNTTFNHFDENI
jgi:hypothetical protein